MVTSKHSDLAKDGLAVGDELGDEQQRNSNEIRMLARGIYVLETNSVTITSAPSSLHMLRKTTSVTPAIGARYRGKAPF